MDKLSRQKLIELVTKICEAEFDSEEEYEYALRELEDNVVDPYRSDYIFHHTPELTPEEIVDKALSYKPICL